MARAGCAAAAPVEPAVANTDKSFSSWVDWQEGQEGCEPLRTSISNSWPQPWQAYSNMGMDNSSVGKTGNAPQD